MAVEKVAGIKDLFQEGLAAGWRAYNAQDYRARQQFECDVLIIGTGAGGGTAAEWISRAGMSVIMVEEGPLRTSNHFHMDERAAYSDLYQEGFGRACADGTMTILQGRCVGGSTTVNWTSSFRTPVETLTHWEKVHGVKGLTQQSLAPFFAEREKRLNVSNWEVPANANNDKLRLGCEKLGIPWRSIPRNVNGCWNLGYCGMGCPTNAKQSMLVTSIPDALKNNAQLIYQARAWRLIQQGSAIKGAICQAMSDDRVTPTGVEIEIRAQHTIVACGGISGPGLLLRSQLPDPHERIGKRTFLHPVPFSMALFSDKVEGYWGAPQSIYSDYFVWKDGAEGPMGFKLEVSPLHPGFVGGLMGGFGTELRDTMAQLPNIHSMIALLRDGFHPQSEGGNVMLREDDTPCVETYPFNDYLRDGIRRSLLTMAEIQFAAGAQKIRPSNNYAPFYSSWLEAKQDIPTLPMERITQRLGCAHVMGGCAMGEDPATSVVNSDGKFHHLDNLYVFDGSIFPTSIGANPQLSIYGIVSKLTQSWLKKLGKPVPELS